MEITLEKIELVKDRTGVTYKEAKEALEKTVAIDPAQFGGEAPTENFYYTAD